MKTKNELKGILGSALLGILFAGILILGTL
jgi:hypothetical protein